MFKPLAIFTGLAAAGILSAVAQEPKPPAAASDVKLESLEQKVGYIIGANIGQNIKRQAGDLDQAALMAGLKDALAGAPSKFTDAEAQELQQAYQEAKMLKDNPDLGKKLTEAAAAEKDFLAKNGKREGVKTTASGLQYEVLKDATGPKPAATDTVKVHYHGTVMDGRVFDSSVDRKTPATFGVSQVIKGWIEGLQLMPVGAKYKFYIPAKLAYGNQQRSEVITPGALLIFEVELLGIEK